MRIPRIPLFRIWYSTTYTTLLFILLLLLAISPAETIYQSIRTREIQKLFVIGGAYFLTFIIVLLIYSTRVYTNRSVLQAIPKPYVPIEKGEVGKLVRRMVVKHLRRSAIIAWDSRPRDVRGEADEEALDAEKRPDTAESKKEKEKAQKRSHHHGSPSTIIPVSAKSPPWGHVSHPGWATPSSLDLPNLQYWGVILELPNLIEAKAVSLAPPDPAVEEDALQYPGNGPPLPDAQIVTLLQRPRALGLREYLLRLSEYGLLNPPSLGAAFLAQYEYARFSTHSLTEQEFRDLMAVFAAILNGMTALDPAVVAEARAHSPYSDTRSLAPTESSTTSSHSSDSRSLGLPYRTPLLNRTRSMSSYTSSASGLTSPSLRSSSSDDAHSPHTLRTAPSRQQHHSSVFATPRTPSTRSLRSDLGSETGSVRIRRGGSQLERSPETILPNSSRSSLGSGRSVVRLRRDLREGELPYEFVGEGD